MPWSARIPTKFLVFRGTRVHFSARLLIFPYRTVTFYGQPFQDYLSNEQFFDLPKRLLPLPETTHYPYVAMPVGFHTTQV